LKSKRNRDYLKRRNTWSSFRIYTNRTKTQTNSNAAMIGDVSSVILHQLRLPNLDHLSMILISNAGPIPMLRFRRKRKRKRWRK
jgi:hypothetical protein